MASEWMIRRMEERDLTAVAELYREMYREQKNFGMVMDFNEEAVSDMLAVQLKSRFFVSLVLEGETGVRGFAVGSLMKTPTKYKLAGQTMIGFVQDVYVTPDARQGGAGARLVNALEAAFAEQGVSYVELHVLEGNEVGQRFWEKGGYRPVIRVMYKHLHEGE
jgi:ribosomal protein S18 acetylase RimI-like enzyme